MGRLSAVERDSVVDIALLAPRIHDLARAVAGDLAPRRPVEPTWTSSLPVLLVEDDDELRESLANGLEALGADVFTASDGDDAHRVLAGLHVAAIITDTIMPAVDGLTLLSDLRATAEYATLPIILLTDAPHHAAIGFGLGASACLRKPATASEILDAIASTVRRANDAAIAADAAAGLLPAGRFRAAWQRDLQDNTVPALFAAVDVAERRAIRERFGPRGELQLQRHLARLIGLTARPEDLRTAGSDGIFNLVVPELPGRSPREDLLRLNRLIASRRLELGGEPVRLTPIIGASTLTARAPEAARHALNQAASTLDLQPVFLDGLPSGTDTRRNLGDRLRRAASLPVQVGTTVFAGLLAPFLAYAGLAHIGADITWPMYIAVVIALLLSAISIWWESLVALRGVQAPPAGDETDLPTATAIIAAYLPNEAATIVETLEAFRRVDYPALQIIVAYNSPVRLSVESELQAIAARDSRVVILRVDGSTSKAQNVNAALAVANGAFTGIFDADHHPEPGVFRRAWRWLANGYDVVQGHPVVRNGDTGLIARTVAAEFEVIYSVAHPGRTAVHGFGLFGGSTGFWRTDVLARIRMRPDMLTEDIDSSLRTVLAGHRIAVDPGIVSHELAPVTVRALWNQRMRWAQGWLQVTLRHTLPALRNPHLTRRQKAGMLHLLAWREAYPWLSWQMFPIIAFWSVQAGGPQNLDWGVPIFVATTLITLSVGPGQALIAYRLAHPAVRRRVWFAAYIVVATIVYTEFKNLISRVAHVRELLGFRQWKVTPRTREQAPETTSEEHRMDRAA